MRGDECEQARLENHEPGVHERSEMIRWVTALARIGLVVAAIAATVPMIAFAQTSLVVRLVTGTISCWWAA